MPAMKRHRKKSSPLLRLMLWGLGTLAVLAAVAGVVGYYWVQSYLESAAFREMLARKVGNAAHANVTLTNLQWSGSTMLIPRMELQATGMQGWRSVEADGIQTTVNFRSARQGVLQVPRVALDRLRLQLRSAAEIPAHVPPPASTESDEMAVPGWLKPWLPSKVQVDEVEVTTVDLVPADQGGLTISRLKFSAKPSVDEGAWLLQAGGGDLTVPGMKDPIQVITASARLDRRALTLNDCVARWTGDSELTVRGDMPFHEKDGWAFAGRLSGLDLKHVVNPDWHSKLTGVLTTDYVAHPDKLTGKIEVRNGVVHGLPMLDRIAEFTRTERFRQVVLDECTADLESTGGVTYLRNLVLQSNGLMRVQGEIAIQGRAIDGRLMLGVLPDSLRWIPGSQARVFTETNPQGPPGFVWTPVRITGTLDAIREDLTDRLLVAMGKAALEAPLDLAGKALNILGTNAPAGTVQDVIRTGQDLLKSDLPGSAVDSGLDVLKSLPIFGR